MTRFYLFVIDKSMIFEMENIYEHRLVMVLAKQTYYTQVNTRNPKINTTNPKKLNLTKPH